MKIDVQEKLKGRDAKLQRIKDNKNQHAKEKLKKNVEKRNSKKRNKNRMKLLEKKKKCF